MLKAREILEQVDDAEDRAVDRRSAGDRRRLVTLAGIGSGEAHHALTAHEVLLVLGSDPGAGTQQRRGAPSSRAVRAQPAAFLDRSRLGPARRPAVPQPADICTARRRSGDRRARRRRRVRGDLRASSLVNALVGYLQESKAEAALDALRRHGRGRPPGWCAAGRTELVDSEVLVPGDVVRLEAGDKVPADLRLIRETDVEVDESALTGESEPVVKDEVTLQVDTLVADRRNMVYSGTLVTSGSGAGVVVSTGAAHRARADPSPRGNRGPARHTSDAPVGSVQPDSHRDHPAVGRADLRRRVSGAGEPGPAMFTAAVALAVGAIPEGLPAAVTITLAIGVGRMARRRAVVRRLPAVETLGSTTVICTDKTGTLTQNSMTVVEVWTPGASYRVDGVGYAAEGAVLDDGGRPRAAATTGRWRRWPRWEFCAATPTCRRRSHDTRSVTPPREHCSSSPRSLPSTRTGFVRGGAGLTSSRSAPRSSACGCAVSMTTILGVAVKGAVERVLQLCDRQLSPDGATVALDRGRVLDVAEQMAGRGLRVLAAAHRAEPGRRADDAAGSLIDEKNLVLVGLFAMHDPPRPAARDRGCRLPGGRSVGEDDHRRSRIDRPGNRHSRSASSNPARTAVCWPVRSWRRSRTPTWPTTWSELPSSPGSPPSRSCAWSARCRTGSTWSP